MTTRLGDGVIRHRFRATEDALPKFRIATPAGTSYTTASDYGYEMEALKPIDAEIYTV